MAQDLMNYEQMTQLALRGVVRDAIRRVIREDGLPGAHHFYITFLTRFPGVEIDGSLAEKYPEEITIVLEHQFWDLAVNDESFEVTLKFGGVPKFLLVPYTSITRFHDPSVGFALQFEPPREMDNAVNNATVAHIDPKTPEQKPANPSPKKKKLPLSKNKAEKDKTSGDDGSKGASSDEEAKVVSLDSFRKK